MQAFDSACSKRSQKLRVERGGVAACGLVAGCRCRSVSELPESPAQPITQAAERFITLLYRRRIHYGRCIVLAGGDFGLCVVVAVAGRDQQDCVHVTILEYSLSGNLSAIVDLPWVDDVDDGVGRH